MSSKGISWLCLSSLLLGVTVMSAAHPQGRRMPDSPTGRMAGALVDLADAPDESAVETFLDVRVTPSAREAMAPMLREYRDLLSAPELDGAKKTGAFSAILTLTSDGTTYRVSYEVAPEEPHQLTSFSVETDSAGISAATPPVEGETDLPPSEVTKGYLEKLAAVDTFSGSVLVARGDTLLYEAAFGLAERASKTPNQTDTLFDIGSITKMMTKVAIGQLARDGKLSLDDTIAAHLHDYPSSEVASSVTIDQLVHHRSGLGDIFNEKFQRISKASLLTPRDFFPIFVDDPLNFVPGSSQQYSNAGYIVLGAIIEAASGQDYVSYIEDNIFAPAGMTESGFIMRDGSHPNLATGYTRGHGGASSELESNRGMLPIRGCPAGSSSHSAKDLWRFERALRNGKLLDAKWATWFFGGDGVSLRFGGGGPGVNAMLELERDLTIVVLANLDPPAARQAAKKLREIWSER